MKAAIYARVSTLDQEPENQLAELRRYVRARSWPEATEYVDKGVSGSKNRRPALDRLIQDAKRRGFDVLVVWRLDRLGRNLRHLVTLLDELQVIGVSFVSLGEGIDCTTPAGRLQLHVLAALAEFERARIAERVKAGLGYCQVDEIPADRPPRCCGRRSSLIRHIAHEIRGFAHNLTVPGEPLWRIWVPGVPRSRASKKKTNPHYLTGMSRSITNFGIVCPPRSPGNRGRRRAAQGPSQGK